MKQFDIQKGKDEEEKKDSKKEKEPKIAEIRQPMHHNKKQGSGFWPYLLGLFIGLVVVLGIMWYLSYRNKTKESETATKTTESQENTNLNANENTNANANENANANSNTNSTASTLDKKQYSLQVQNGNGVTGDAAKVKTLLTNDGWVVKSVSNANNFNYASTTVYYKSASEAAAKAVSDVLKNNNRQAEMQASTTIKYDIVVITGKK